jgi:hypothetical protein
VQPKDSAHLLYYNQVAWPYRPNMLSPGARFPGANRRVSNFIKRSMYGLLFSRSAFHQQEISTSSRPVRLSIQCPSPRCDFGQRAALPLFPQNADAQTLAMLLRLLSLLTLLTGALSAPAPAERRTLPGPVTEFTTTQVDSYIPYSWFAAATYCPPASQATWSCGE